MMKSILTFLFFCCCVSGVVAQTPARQQQRSQSPSQTQAQEGLSAPQSQVRSQSQTPPQQQTPANSRVYASMAAGLQSQLQTPEMLAQIQNKLDLASESDPNLQNEVDLSVGNILLTDLVRNIATVNKVNISVRSDNNIMVNCNLSRARITDIIYFLCREYNMTIDVTGNIISMYPYRAPSPSAHVPTVVYKARDSTLTYDLRAVTLGEAARLITDSSGVNFIISPGLLSYKITGYGVGIPVDDAIATIAQSNDLDVFRSPQGLWTFSRTEQVAADGSVARRRPMNGNEIEIDSLGLITVQITRGSARNIISEIMDRLMLNYYFISGFDFQSSLFLKEVELNTLLKILLIGTDYSWYVEEGIYMFGEHQKSRMSATEVIPLRNRTVSRLSEVIPAELKEGVQIDVFKDLNSIIVTGDSRRIARVQQFIHSVDRTIPLVMIDVIIMDVNKTLNQEVGLKLGSGNEPSPSNGVFLSDRGTDVNLGASAINSIINGFNGFGSMNLGRVGPNFYANLKLLEEAGDVELQSTPRLSTLNGQEASLKSGETIFYKEVRESLTGSQNPIQTSSYEWKSVDANLTLKIIPFVSQNNEITLTIDLEQKEFLDRKDEETPPGSYLRSFKSELRVQNEDTVLLGGIDRNSKTKSSGGLPFIARVPVLKWIFGHSKKQVQEKKLSIFIKATVIN